MVVPNVSKANLRKMNDALEGHKTRIGGLVSEGKIDLHAGKPGPIPKKSIENTMKMWFPKEDHEKLYEECNHLLGTSNLDELVDAAHLFQEIYKQSPSNNWRTSGILAGQKGTRPGQHEENVNEFAAAKLIMMALMGWENSQSIDDQPNSLADIVDYDPDLANQVVVPAIAFFEAYYVHRNLVIAPSVLVSNITAFEVSVRARAEKGVWSNAYIMESKKDKLDKTKQKPTKLFLQKAGAGIFLPYAGLLAIIVPGFLRVLQRSTGHDKPQYVTKVERVTTARIEELAERRVCLVDEP